MSVIDEWQHVPAPAEHAPAKHQFDIPATASQPERVLVTESESLDAATANEDWISAEPADCHEVRP
jgi:hypothetical protein